MPHDGQNSILTKNQREFLDGEVDFSWADSRGRPTRSRMRKRVLAGLSDFSFLADPDRLDERDAGQIAHEVTEEMLAEVVAFVYRMAPNRFEAIVEAGVRRGVKRIHPDWFVEQVDISIRRQDDLLTEVEEKMNRNEPLTDRELRVALQRGEQPAEELREYVKAHPPQDLEDWSRRFR